MRSLKQQIIKILNQVIESNKTYIGHIIGYDSERFFGFVEDNAENSYYFHFNRTIKIQQIKRGLIDKSHKFCSGDEVQFKLRSSLHDLKKIEAYDLIFIRNVRRERLIAEALTSEHLFGYLKLIDSDKLFVKHKTTYVFIPLEISDWVQNFDQTYTNRIDSLVSFSLTQTKHIDKLKAVLTDIKYIDEYYILQSAKESATILHATITGKNSKGLFATILDGNIHGFIPISKNLNHIELLRFESLRKGNVVDVLVSRINSTKSVGFLLPPLVQE